MPTAPKLVAAVLLCGLGYGVAILAIAYAPDNLRPDNVPLIAAALGILWGWRFLGRGVGRGLVTGLGIGLTSAVALAASTLLLVGFIQMIRKSMRMSYDGPFEALLDWVSISLRDAGTFVFQADVLAALVVGGLVAGVIVTLAGKRWS